MGLMKQHLPEGGLVLRVRITTGEPYFRPLSDWSDRFILVDDAAACAASGLTPPTPGPTTTPFPPTPPVRGVAGDLWADVVIGKPDFSQIVPNEVVPFKVFNPGGVVVDRSVDPGRAYIWDSGNSRILGIDLAACYESDGPCSAVIVIGQPSPYDHSACNGDSGVQDYPVRAPASAETLCGIPDHSLSPWESYSFVSMAVDADGNLYVPDPLNNRVLKYDAPFENDSVADEVWGQAEFTGITCNRGEPSSPTAETLCFRAYTNRPGPGWRDNGNGAEIDPDGNLWIADSDNNRVLRFPVDPDSGEIAKTADLVLGQPDFHSSDPGDAPDRMHTPSAVRVDPDRNVYVVDTVNDRVLVFEPPFESGMPADRGYGSQFRNPTSLEVDPEGQGIWVRDTNNGMIELWDWGGAEVKKVLGKTRYQPDSDCGDWSCISAGSVGIDRRGNLLVPVTSSGMNDVLRFPAPIPGIDSGGAVRSDKRLFYPPTGFNFMSRRASYSSRGVVAWGDQLITSDIFRLMFWNGLGTLENGQPADGVVGDEFLRDQHDECCGRIKVDEAGRLWVLGFEGRHFIDVYQLPLTKHAVPIHTMWTREMSFPVLGSVDEITFKDRIFGIAPMGVGDFLWVSDTDNHRVVRIRDPFSNPKVDVVLGQTDAVGTLCNRRAPAVAHVPHDPEIHQDLSLDMLCFPGALSIDREGNLYVADHALEVEGNYRMLVFAAESIPYTNSETIFAPHAAKVFVHAAERNSRNLWTHPLADRSVIGEYSHTLLAATWEPAFDSTNRMVVGYNGYLGPRFVGVYDDPLGLETLPTSYLYDFGSMPYTATFDDDDNLYIGDINRGRVLVYYNPFNSPAREASSPLVSAAAPVPSYPVTIESVSPEPPYCVLREPPRSHLLQESPRSHPIQESLRSHGTTLKLVVDGLSASDDATLEFRKVGSRYRHRMRLDRARSGSDESLIVIAESEFWERVWPNYEKLTMTVRITTDGEEPLSSWSPAFLLADDVSSCGAIPPNLLDPAQAGP